MYSLVFTILASTFLIVLGCGAMAGALLIPKAVSFAIFMLMLFGLLFVAAGVRSMIQTVHFLRGGRREGKWRRWMFDVPPRRDWHRHRRKDEEETGGQ